MNPESLSCSTLMRAKSLRVRGSFFVYAYDRTLLGVSMKAIWLLFSFTVVGLSIYPDPIVVGQATINFHQFWLSDSLFVRANQLVLLFSLIGFIRDFKKYPGKLSGRLAMRFFLIFASIATLYLPWDYLSNWDNLVVKILLTLVGAFSWFIGFGMLIPTPTPEQIAQQKAMEASRRTSGTPSQDATGSTWFPENKSQQQRTPNIPAANPGDQLTSKLKPTKSADDFSPRENQSVLSMGIRDLAGIKNCPNCGTDSTPYGKFCKECGSKF